MLTSQGISYPNSGLKIKCDLTPVIRTPVIRCPFIHSDGFDWEATWMLYVRELNLI